MFSSTETHLNAGTIRFLGNSAPLQRTVPHPSPLPFAIGSADMTSGRRLPHALGVSVALPRRQTSCDRPWTTVQTIQPISTPSTPAPLLLLMLRTFGLYPPRPNSGMMLCGSWAKTLPPRRGLLSDRRQIAGMNGKGICAGASFALRGNSSPSVVVL